MGTYADDMATPNDDSRRISASVSEALRDAGLAQRFVADETGIPMTTLGRSLTGRRAFDTDELALISRLLDMSITALITYADREPVAS